MTTRQGWLLLRRHGSLWGVPHQALRELPRGQPPRLELDGGTVLVADELLHLAADFEPHVFPRCARSFYPEEIRGLAVWRQQPVILVEPEAAAPSGLRESSAKAARDKPEMDIHVDKT